MGRVPGWFLGFLVELRLHGYRFVTKGFAVRMAEVIMRRRVSPESIARYIRWAVEEGYLTPRRSRRGRKVYYLTGKVDGLVEIRDQDVLHPLTSADPFTL